MIFLRKSQPQESALNDENVTIGRVQLAAEVFASQNITTEEIWVGQQYLFRLLIFQ